MKNKMSSKDNNKINIFYTNSRENVENMENM